MCEPNALQRLLQVKRPFLRAHVDVLSNPLRGADQICSHFQIVTNMLPINIPYAGYSTQDSAAMSAGKQTSVCETWFWFQHPSRSIFKHSLSVFSLAKAPFSDSGDHGEQMFSFFCLLTHKSQSQRPGLGLLHTHTVYPSCLCIPVCVGPVNCCFTLKEITDVSKNSAFANTASLPCLETLKVVAKRR